MGKRQRRRGALRCGTGAGSHGGLRGTELDAPGQAHGGASGLSQSGDSRAALRRAGRAEAMQIPEKSKDRRLPSSWL
ncbi:hypothetical protein CCAX7_63220 [Capsulimonas corticalis]|uniref:Uncharacterized protein n=1 Tax=Capsulimonas corticalis TaxID=2219043 RepID=A0A402CWU6_9BACT|nr:hypothetical protein CCAX7_63220 [Capsulimonas corticalis]